MLIIPAIDILSEKCVRLVQGDFKQKTVYASDPVQVAQQLEQSGAHRLHIVDLDGAKTGRPVHMDLILKIKAATSVPIQVGGGIDSPSAAALYLAAGIFKVIIGSKAVSDPDFVKSLLASYGPNRITVSIDIKDSHVYTRGWQDNTKLHYVTFAKSLKKWGIKELICTDIKKDGMLQGPNFAPLIALQKLGFSVIASGGVSSLQAIRTLCTKKLLGAIIGKALYEQKIDLKAAISEATGDSLAKRIIPCMDIADAKVVKGTHFQDLKVMGDPVTLAAHYETQGADELVFLDISASHQKRKTLTALVKQVAQKITIPFTVGGGICTCADIETLLKAGADKVSIGSYALENPDFITQAAKRFGSQCLVISLDAKKAGQSWELYTHGGRYRTPIDAIAFAQKMEQAGAGELLVNSLDRDGTGKGYDMALLQAITSCVHLPVIASSGAGSMFDFQEALTTCRCDAVLAASVFHTHTIPIPQLKKALAQQDIPIRL